MACLGAEKIRLAGQPTMQSIIGLRCEEAYHPRGLKLGKTSDSVPCFIEAGREYKHRC